MEQATPETPGTTWQRHQQRFWRFTPPFQRWRHIVGGAYLSALRGPVGDLKRTALVTTGRTGSELLVQLLNSHPDMRCDSEVLDFGPDWPRLFLRGRAAAAARDGASVHGFKLTANQLRWPVLVRQPRLLFDDLEHAGVTFIRLRRRDIVRQAISHERAKAVDRWHNGSPSETPDLCPAEVIRTLVWLEEQDEILDHMLAGRQVHELVYEDDLATRDQQARTTARLFDTLGLPPHEATAWVQRDSPSSIADMVGNWPELRAAIGATRFHDLLALVA